jgi:hypothetical protein
MKIIGIVIVFTVVLIVALSTLRNRYCYADAACRIGVTTSNTSEAYLAILSYLNKGLTSGITERQALDILERISSLKDLGQNKTTISVSGKDEVATIHDYLIPFDFCGSIEILVIYKSDGTLHHYSIRSD